MIDSVSSLNDYFLEVQTKVKHWFLSNKLIMNSTKTQQLVFSIRDLNSSNEPIKFIGVFLDSDVGSSHWLSLTKLKRKLFMLPWLVPVVFTKTACILPCRCTKQYLIRYFTKLFRFHENVLNLGFIQYPQNSSCLYYINILSLFIYTDLFSAELALIFRILRSILNQCF